MSAEQIFEAIGLIDDACLEESEALASASKSKVINAGKRWFHPARTAATSTASLRKENRRSQEND